MAPSTRSSTVAPRCRRMAGPWGGHAAGRRLIFLHIPKTAGTAITSFLRQQYDDADVMPQLQANFHRSHPIWPLVARRYQLLGVGMHLDHDRVAALARGLSHEPPPFLLTVLREPRARLLSRYKEWRSTPDEHMQAARDHVREAILTARTKSFCEFLQSDNPVVVSTLDNLQARLLAGLNLSRKLDADELLQRARANLASYDLVGTTARCDDTLAVLSEAYGWPQPPSELARVHQSQPVPNNALRTDDAAEEKIAAYTALDQALWDDLRQDRLPESTSAAAPPPTVPQPVPPQRSLIADLRLETVGDHAANPPAAEPADRGPGYPTVAALVERAQPNRVFGVGRKKWFPSLEEDPQPLAADERVLFVLRFPALSHQRSLILRQAAVPAESLLAITEVDGSDPRLQALLSDPTRQPSLQPFLGLAGSGTHAVLLFAVGRFQRQQGPHALDEAIESLERMHSTHPTALQSLHDTPASRTLATLLLKLSLKAVAERLEAPSPSSAADALLGTLRPEDHDPLLQSQAPCSGSLPARIEQLAVAHTAAAAPDEADARRFSKRLHETAETLRRADSDADTVDLASRVDAYAKVFDLLHRLTETQRTDRTGKATATHGL